MQIERGAKAAWDAEQGGHSPRDLVLSAAPTLGAARRISRFRRFSLALSPGFLLCKNLEAQLSPNQENTQGCICNNGRWLSTALVFHNLSYQMNSGRTEKIHNMSTKALVENRGEKNRNSKQLVHQFFYQSNINILEISMFFTRYIESRPIPSVLTISIL